MGNANKIYNAGGKSLSFIQVSSFISVKILRLVTGILILLGIGFADMTACVSIQSRQIPISSSYHDYNKILSEQELFDLAQKITVKVITEEAGGSGIIIKKTNNSYFVLTNNHVLQNSSNYKIKTYDSQIYSAEIVKKIKFGKNDLALLQFSSKSSYKVAALGKSTNIEVGDSIIAVGYPFQEDRPKLEKFKFTIGKISIANEKILAGGYQIGYTNEVEKGMSGGAVINLRGEVIAINGMHAYPIFGDPYIYTDNTKPCKPMRELMIESSWAIPIETFKKLAVDFYNDTKDKTLSEPLMRSNVDEVPYHILLMRSRADSAKTCTW